MEQLCNCILFYLGADNAETSDSTCAACADIRYSGDVVEVYPLAVLAGNYALCSEYHAVLLLVSESFKSGGYLLSRVGVGSLNAPACEHLIGMMVMVVVMVMASAGAVRAVVVVVMLVLIVVVMVVMMLVLILIVMVMVVMMLVLVLIVVVMVVVMLVLVLIVMVVMMLMFVLIVMVVMMLMFVFIVMVMVVMMLVLSLFKKSLQLVIKGILLSHSVNKLLACELVPLSCNDRSYRVERLQAGNDLVYLLSGKSGCMAEDDAACIGYLVVEEFTEVLLIHLALLCVYDSSKAVELYIVSVYILNSTDNVAELAYAGGLDEDTVRSVVCQYLFQSLSEVTYQRAADASGVHFSYFDTGFLKKTAVDTDVTELILDEHQLFAVISLFYQLFDEGGLSGSEETGENCYLSHIKHFFLMM